MSALKENLSHLVHDAKMFLHEDAGVPHKPAADETPGKRYLRMMQMSDELEAQNQNENNHDPALDQMIADLISHRR